MDLGCLRAHTDVVAVEGDVEDADRDGHGLYPIDLGCQPPSQVVAPGRDPHQDQAPRTLVPLEDLVGDAGDRAADLARVEQPPALDERRHGRCIRQKETPRGCRGASWSVLKPSRLPSRPHRTGLKGEVRRHSG